MVGEKEGGKENRSKSKKKERRREVCERESRLGKHPSDVVYDFQ